jgi:hypothetical protein
MSKKTWFKLYRGWQDNPMFRSDRDRLNWLWLIENTVYNDEHKISVNNSPCILKRGELSYSIRYLAQAWKTTPSYVRSFLKHLEKWHAIETQNDTGQNIITICNYSKYQDIESQNDTGLSQNTTQGRHRDDTNNKKEKKEKKDNKNISVPDFIDGDTWFLWLKHRKEIKKSLTATQAEKQIEKLSKWHHEGDDVNEIILQSITQGWTGLFKQKERNNNGKSRIESIAEQTQRIIQNGL